MNKAHSIAVKYYTTAWNGADFFGRLGGWASTILVIFKPYTLEETVIEKALHANECEEMNRGIHFKSGSSFMGLTVNAGISIWNEECSAWFENHQNLKLIFEKNA